MSATKNAVSVIPTRPKRADARRNYDKVITAARETFTERGADTSLEEIARRAGVGIGTLYRNFPNRQALLEAVYVEEVERVCAGIDDLSALEPWEALTTWLHRFVGYIATKQALADELLEFVDRGSPLFNGCRASMYAAGEPLLARAQAAGVARADAEVGEVVQLVIGVAKVAADAAQIDHMLEIVLDGLRRRDA